MSEFIQRHIGPSKDEQAEMLTDLELTSVDELVRQVVPDSILLRGNLYKLPEGCDEQEALTELKEQIIQQIDVLVEELGGTMCHLTKCTYTGRQSKIIQIEYNVEE